MEHEKPYIRFLCSSFSFGKFLSKIDASTFDHAVVKEGKLYFVNTIGQHHFFDVNDISYIKDTPIIEIARVRVDWLKKNCLSLPEQPVTVYIIKGNIYITLSH